MKAYSKAIAAFIFGVLGNLGAVLVASGQPNAEAFWVALGTGLVAAVAVYAAPANQPNV